MRAKPDLYFVPKVSISPGCIAAYNEVVGGRKGSKKDGCTPTVAKPEPNNFPRGSYDWLEREAEIKTYEEYLVSISGHENLKKDPFNGAMSFAAKKRIRMAINCLYVLSDEKRFGYKNRGRFKLNMFTITLSASQAEMGHTDDFVKKEMLNRLLEDMRRVYGLKSYIWRAEIQAENTNNIHFHITTNIYIDCHDFRHMWNRIQAKHGYIDAFERKFGHRDPPSTDVHKVEDVTNLAGYLAKYMAKSAEGRPISGRQWFLSSNLSKIKPVQLDEWSGLSNEIAAFTTERKKFFVRHEYVAVSYADIFSGDLSAYPLLQEVKKAFFDSYHHTVN